MKDNNNCQHSKILPCFSSSLFICSVCSTLVYITETNEKIRTVKPYSQKVYNELIPQLFSIEDEIRPKDYQEDKQYISIRKYIVKYMKEITKILKLNLKTFYLALEYFDKISLKFNSYDPRVLFHISQFCINLAAKFNENGKSAVLVQRYFEKEIKTENFRSDECYVLELLNHQLQIITPYELLIEFMNVGFIFEGENVDRNKMNKIYQKILQMLYFLTESKYYYELTPKQITMGIIGVVREFLQLEAFSSIFNKVFSFKNSKNLYIEGISKIKTLLKCKNETKNPRFNNEESNNSVLNA